jgi:hypothetical protein
MKFLKPLYGALLESGQTEIAQAAFGKYASGYHPIAQAVVQNLINAKC